MHFPVRSALSVFALATFLTACGGGDEGAIVDEEDPTPSGMSATMTVSGATGADVDFNGVYTSNDVGLNNVVKVNPVGGAPETCRFQFNNLPQVGNAARGMSGEIRYFPGSAELNVAFVSVGSSEFSIEGLTDRVIIDRANNRVQFNAATMQSTGASSNTFNGGETRGAGTGRSITVTGEIPMRGNRPEGC